MTLSSDFCTFSHNCRKALSETDFLNVNTDRHRVFVGRDRDFEDTHFLSGSILKIDKTHFCYLFEVKLSVNSFFVIFEFFSFLRRVNSSVV